MKLIMVIYFFCVGIFCKVYVEKVVEIEKEIYLMYISDFQEYLKFENYNLLIDKEKIKKQLEDKGYEITFTERDYKFKVKFKCLFNFEREYYFYMVVNHEK